MTNVKPEIRRLRTLVAGALGLATTLLATVSPSLATTVRRVDVAEQVDEADLIFRGRMVGRETVVSANGRTPYTLATFVVDEVLKGETESIEITLRLLGGEMEDEVVVVHGMPTFEIDERVVLFVKDSGRAFCPIVGWGQGKLRMLPDPDTGEELLVGEAGEPLLGIANGRWVRGAPRAELAGDPEAPGISVVADLDVAAPTKVDGGRPASGDGRTRERVVRAESVLETLRSFVRERSAKAGFRPGKRVASVDRRAVPPDLGGVAVVPEGSAQR